MDMIETYMIERTEWGRQIKSAGDAPYRAMPPLARCVLEFADDQQLVMCTERIPGVPRERHLEEKLIARWLADQLYQCVVGYQAVAGFQIEMEKGFSVWTAPPPKIPDNCTHLLCTHILEEGLGTRCAGDDRMHRDHGISNFGRILGVVYCSIVALMCRTYV